MSRSSILKVENISYGFEEEKDFESFSYDFQVREWVHIICQKRSQQDSIVRVLLGQQKPHTGEMIWYRKQSPYSDVWIREGLQLEKTFEQSLQSIRFSNSVWLDQRRYHPYTLLEMLGVPIAEKRMALKEVSSSTFYKCWLIFLMVTKSPLLLVSELFSQLSQSSIDLIRRWQPWVSGSVILCGDIGNFQSLCHTKIDFSAEGMAHIQPVDDQYRKEKKKI